MAPRSENHMTPSYRSDEVEFPTKLRWIQYMLEHYGVPTVLLCAVLYWFATCVAQPLIQSHVEFLKTEQESSRSIVRTQEKQAELTGKALGTLTRLESASVRTDDFHGRQLKILEVLAEKK